MSDQRLGYSEEDDQVVLRMNRQDWETLLMLMGYGRGIFQTAAAWGAFANRLNEGNPKYTPYEVDR